MALVETETILVGTARTVRVTVYEETGVQMAPEVFRARVFKPAPAPEEVTVLSVEPGTTSTFKYSLNFTIVGKWTLRMESDRPDATWEKVWTVMASRAPTPNQEQRMPGKRWKAFKKAAGKAGAKRYHKMTKAGVPKRIAAPIAIKGKTKAGRKAMARKAARTRARRKK